MAVGTGSKVRFSLLKALNSLLNRPFANQPVDQYGLVLADAPGTVCGLLLCRRVPPA